MPTPRFRYRSTTNNQSRRDWKDHPLVVGVGAVVATSVFFMTVVIPLRVDLLTSKVERLTELSTNAVATAQELEQTKRKLADARGSLQASLKKSPFHGRSIYPIGFDEVVIGTSESDLLSRRPNGTWNKELSYYTVQADIAGPVKEATYYFTKTDGKRFVKLILFFLGGDADGEPALARKHFMTSFGEPDSKRGDEELWKITDREWVILNTNADSLFGTYSVEAAESSTQDFLNRSLSR